MPALNSEILANDYADNEARSQESRSRTSEYLPGPNERADAEAARLDGPVQFAEEVCLQAPPSPTTTNFGSPQSSEYSSTVTAIRPLTIWSPAQFLEWQEPPGGHYLLPKFLSREQILSIIGPPGVGKSRLSLRLAIAQILTHPWCGLATGGDPQRWLMLGDENSVARLQDDLQRMLGALSPDERARVEALLRIQAVLESEDGDLDLQDDVVVMRIVSTLSSWEPGIIVFDPLSSFYAGDLSKPGEMKTAVRLVQQTVTQGARGASTIVSHHARTGRTNTAQAVGFDAGNFSLGGKALLARSRCVINLAEADEKGTGNVLVACAKANDCPKFPPRAVLLDPVTMNYKVDPDFNLDAWKALIDGKAGASQQLCTLRDVVESVRDGYCRTKQLLAHLRDTMEASDRTVFRHVQTALKADYLKSVTRGNYTLGPKARFLLETR